MSEALPELFPPTTNPVFLSDTVYVASSALGIVPTRDLHSAGLEAFGPHRR